MSPLRKAGRLSLDGTPLVALPLVALVLAACASDVGGVPRDEGRALPAGEDAGGSSQAPRSTIPLDQAGCLDLTAHHPRPIVLAGKLVVTYYEPSLEQRICEWDEETTTYWCPSTAQESAACAEVAGVFWCPNANPPADRLGDPQELASFELSNPGAGVRRWTNNLVHEAELDISPDGKKVVYAVRKKMDAFDDGMGIWVADSDGNNARQVVDRKGHTGIPTWLPPGNDRFTFIADGLHVFDMRTSTTLDVAVAGFDSGLIIDPEGSHDGKKIVFKADGTGGNAPSIYVMDFDGTSGSTPKQLTRGYSDHDPVFSRDNRKIYFERYYGPGEWDQYDSGRLENPEINQWGIVEVDLQSGAERVLVPHDRCGKHFFWLPTVSPDGKHIMFIHDYVAEDGYQDLWVADADGEHAQPVPGTRGFHWFDWSE